MRFLLPLFFCSSAFAGFGTFGPNQCFVPKMLGSTIKIYVDTSSFSGFADGDAVGTAPDLSGNGNHLTAVLTARPTYKVNIINGRPVMRFDGTANYLSAVYSQNQPGTYFVVYRLASAAQDKLRLIDASVNRWSMNNNNASVFSTGFAGSNITDASAADTGPHVHTFVVNGASSSLSKDGATTGAGFVSGDCGANSLGTSIYIGTSTSLGNWLNGDIAELVLCDTSVASNDRKRIEQFFNRRYKLY